MSGVETVTREHLLKILNDDRYSAEYVGDQFRLYRAQVTRWLETNVTPPDGGRT